MLFNIFTSGADSGIKCTLSKFADDSRMSNVVDFSDEWDDIQRNLYRLDEWTHKNLININKAKCKVLHVGGDNLQYQYKLGGEMTGLALERDEKGNMSWQHMLAVQKVNHILGFMREIWSA
ncbi:rna-directed dna polymerase from mobile element jockey-like [Willisornis vidua]|uniref:Rna-directed dna polymerase from mobile element jockey-like n=1 Tax=Willisornis vidua TaxID=1566151 RepID=A0ABQ9CU77_9PASS|nr:rna-directed dna polymerase from mobile element jockey-like [Willisornis vidua]